MHARAIATLADGREIDARGHDRPHDGRPVELDNAKAMACGSCELLLGSNALSTFNMSIAQVQGMDVATLSPRMAMQ